MVAESNNRSESVARSLRSPKRKISNRGERPRFIGEYCSQKAVNNPIVYSSVTELYVGLYLEWREDIAQFSYETSTLEFEINDVKTKFHPDFDVVYTSGEIGHVEAKYSEDSLSQKEATRLHLESEYCKKNGLGFDIYYRRFLEENHFIGHIRFLRRYKQIPENSQLRKSVVESMSPLGAGTLKQWVQRASEHKAPLWVTYQLLYDNRLPLIYEPMYRKEFELCRGW